MQMYKEQTYPIIVPAIADINKKHWKPRVEKRFIELRNIVREADESAYFEAMQMNAQQQRPFALT